MVFGLPVAAGNDSHIAVAVNSIFSKEVKRMKKYMKPRVVGSSNVHPC